MSDIISIKKYRYDQVLSEVRENRKLIDKIKKHVKWYMQRGGLPTFKNISKRFEITYNKLNELIEYEEDLDRVTGIKLNNKFYRYNTIADYQAIILE